MSAANPTGVGAVTPVAAPEASAQSTDGTVLVWDLPVRLGHWLMAGGFAVAWLTGESESWRLVHVLAGGLVVAVALFRIVWGLIGSRPARFAEFVKDPQAALAYLKSLLGGAPQHHPGHNPAGGWAVLAMLALALLAGASGWLTYQELGGDWLEELHESAVNAMLVLVGVHLVGVAVGSLAHRENLPRAMLTGKKHAPADAVIRGSHPLVAMVLLIWAVSLAWWLSR